MPLPSKRPRIIGPFFLIALVLSAGVFYWQKQSNALKLQSAPPPVVEHQVIDTATDSVPLDVVTTHAKELRLTATQLRRLEPLVKAYQTAVKPLQAELFTASQSFAAYQQSKAGAKQVPMAELQAQMSELSAISGRIVALRQRYWEQVAPILTQEQQAQARKLWQQVLSRPASAGAR